MNIPLPHCLLLASLIFSLGFLGVLVRRNIIFMVLSIEIMFNAAGFAFIAVSSHLGQADGQVLFIFILAVAAAEVAIGLGLVLKYYEHFGSLDIGIKG